MPGERWDLVVTMDDATNEHHSMFLCDEEGTRSSFLGIRETVEARGRSERALRTRQAGWSVAHHALRFAQPDAQNPFAA